MSWVKLDDALPRHPKMLGLPCSAKWAYIEALCYCAQYLTDGCLPAGVIPDKDAKALVEAGLIEMNSDSYCIHDYLEYNPSRSDVQAKSKANRNAARKRWADVVQSESNASRMQNALGVGEAVDLELQEQGVFDRFWSVYPLRKGKIKARQEFDALVANGVDPETVIASAERYRDDTARKPDYTAHPSTWLHQGRWLDEASATEADRTLALIQAHRGGS